MRCQLAVFKNNEAHPERIGWFVWVKDEPPALVTARLPEGANVLEARSRYQTPYLVRAENTGPVVIQHGQVELLPIFHDVPKQPYESWLAHHGEPDPQLAHDIEE